MLKKYLLLIIFLLSFFLSSAAVNTPAKQSSIIRVGVYDNPPKIFKDPQGRPCGFWVDIIKNIAEKENWEISWVHGSWSDSIKKLKNNEIDVMPDVAYSEERSKIFDFSEQTIFVNWARIFVPTDSNIISFLDLDGKKIGVMKKGIHYIGSNGIKNLIKRFDINATFIVYEGYFEILEAVQENQVDAGVVNRIFGHKYHKNYDVRRTSIIINPIELKFAFPKDTPKTSLLINKFDFHVDKLKKDEGSLYHRYVHDLLVPLKHEKKFLFFPTGSK
ncbi:MAG: transporter substrate-binding domain-containing protein [Candidatus Mcinerneyibacterium aminivorans]|uniref:Transporter substrate-binding domain-containing protein n=1 Tax=Candidatus Mcinerneyibacterium aminivorans TaxID=2703815 RepID=A0A5D0MIR7_9BACT|nr:MAG: transporter substrate-binding domain-containing protein [Candidatus Mcinerneyibacterium aminivorans]